MCISSSMCGGNDAFTDEIKKNFAKEADEEKRAKKAMNLKQGKTSGFWLGLLRGLNATINYFKPCRSEQENVSSSPWWRNYKKQK